MADTMDDYESFVDGVASAFWVAAWAGSVGVHHDEMSRLSSDNLERLYQSAPEAPTECYEAACAWAGRLPCPASLRVEADASALEQVPAYYVGWLLGLDALGLRGWAWEYSRFMPVPRVEASISPTPEPFSFCLTYV